jgi:SEC-C motif
MLTRTPSPLDRHVIAFCRGISPKAKPVLLPIKDEAGAIPLECFSNVRSKVSKEGGRIVFGWAIWEWPNVYVEAEHHAVYEGPDGCEWLDITPSETPNIFTRVFIEDASAVYDFQNEGIRRDNHRLALHNDPLIQEFFRGAKAITEALNKLPGIGEIIVPEPVARHIQTLEINQAHRTMALVRKYLKRNDPCFCGSGRKFKACHGVGR